MNYDSIDAVYSYLIACERCGKEYWHGPTKFKPLCCDECNYPGIELVTRVREYE